MSYSQADFTSYAQGDIPYASATDTLSKLAIGSSGQVLTVSAGIPSWATNSSVGGVVQLVGWTVLGASSATITFSSISGSYNNLMLVFNARSDRAGNTLDNVNMSFNSDTTAANYYNYAWRTSGTTPTITVSEQLATVGAVSIVVGATGATATSGYRSHAVVYIMDYASTTRYRQVQWQLGVQTANTTGSLINAIGRGQWQNTSNAITSITLAPSAGTNFVAGTAYALFAF